MTPQPYKVTELHFLNPHMLRVLLAPLNKPLAYRAGQYVFLTLPNAQEGRPYSIANAPNTHGVLEFHIRVFRDNPFTLDLQKQLQERGEISLWGPQGQCTLARRHGEKPILFLAGGTGFAPLKALIEESFEEDTQKPMHLFWGAENLEDLYSHSLPESWQASHAGFRFTPVVNQAPPSWEGAKGLVHHALLAQYPDLKNYQIYASGPEAMVRAALADGLSQGLERTCLYADALDLDEAERR